jgi:hypothetical protein
MTMNPIAMNDAEHLSDAERLETARELMQWAGYYLAHVSATPTSHRARVDLSIATDTTREALAERQVPGFVPRPDLFSTPE